MITLLFLFIIEPLLFQETAWIIIIFSILLFKTASFITQGKEFACNFKQIIQVHFVFMIKHFTLEKIKHSKQIYKN